MSRFCSSTSSSSSLLAAKLGPRQVLSFLCPVEILEEKKPQIRQRERRPRLSRMVSNVGNLESWFISSLANAGRCHKHASKPLPPPSFFTSRRPDTLRRIHRRYNVSVYRNQHTSAASEPNRTKEELLALVDGYDGWSYTDQLPVELPPLYQPPDGPNLTVSDKKEDEWPPPHYAWPSDPVTKEKIRSLDIALKDKYTDPEEIYQIYRSLPAPRVPYLESKTRHRMLHHFSVVEKKDEHSMLRYLSVVDDVKNAAIPLSTTEWNSAISFVSRYVARSTEVEVEAALHMWREMEHTANVKGTGATFNILFDVACKAGKFALAEMIYKEMDARGLRWDRYHHVSIIFAHGLRQNGDAARQAYRQLIEAGEIVDTSVLNAMISALIRSHEPSAAEAIYTRMKEAHFASSNPRLQPTDFIARRSINRTLVLLTAQTRGDRVRQQQLQAESIIAPDLQTFRILLNHFAVSVGELDKTAKLLNEMKWFLLPMHGAVFLALFKGFTIHGGIRYTRWTEDRLEKVWRSYMSALQAEEKGLYVSRWMALWIIRAFSKCVGKERMMEVWSELREFWNPTEDESEFVLGYLRGLQERQDDMALKKQEWILGSGL